MFCPSLNFCSFLFYYKDTSGHPPIGEGATVLLTVTPFSKLMSKYFTQNPMSISILSSFKIGKAGV